VLLLTIGRGLADERVLALSTRRLGAGLAPWHAVRLDMVSVALR